MSPTRTTSPLKPALVWAIVVILIATALGVLSGLPLMRTARTSAS